MPQGVIVKALSGYYYVRPDHQEEWVTCRARGVFKKRGMSPLVGDRVTYLQEASGEGTVTELLPRSTELVRPPIANVELAVLVFSVHEPELNRLLLDKFLVHTEQAGLETMVCLTKFDLLSNEDAYIQETIDLYKQIGYAVFSTSSVGQSGIEEVKTALKGRIGVFSGQSGVGKSSLLNAIVPGLTLETNEISHRLGRGKHTTRHVELIELPDGGYIADTPGFSQLDFMNLEPVDLSACFKEFAQLHRQCKFRGCLHDNEPGCAVVEAVQAGEIASSRYENYLLFLKEIKEQKRRY